MGAFQEEKRETCMRTTCLNPGINSWEDTHTLNLTHTHRLPLWPMSQFSPAFFQLDCSLARCAHSTWKTNRVHWKWLRVRRWSTGTSTHTHTHTYQQCVGIQLESRMSQHGAWLTSASRLYYISDIANVAADMNTFHNTLQVVQPLNCEMVKSWI